MEHTTQEIEHNYEGLDVVCERPSTLVDSRMHYCPGCGHGVAHRIIMEAVQELGIQSQTVGVAPVGCSVFAYHYMNIDMQEAAHGRATAVATGIKRYLPDKYVFTYQGDGDLAAIGTAETLHTVNRGENILIVFVNNAIYGMTGGQMAPTTLIGQKTSTSPYGRETQFNGNPLKITELMAMLPGAFYVTRQAVNTPGNVRKAKKAILNGFKWQALNKGTCFVEIVSNCPTNWGMKPVESLKFIEEHMLPFFPLGDMKVPSKEELENG
jgi:2-oxoglutarate/2-oxoacid ferredoxin oxidoreductase subunit beta